MKNYFLTLLLTILAFNCNSDDDQGTDTTDGENAVVRITAVNTDTNEIILTNLGPNNTDVSDYWLCLGPGTYRQVSTTTDSSTNLATNETVTLSYSVDEMSGGLGLFSTNTFTSSDPTVLLDYVQWGAADQARVDQAITAGRWDNAMRFVDGMSPYSFDGDAGTFGSTVWSGTPIVLSDAVIRITAVNTDTNEIILTNLGPNNTDVSDYWLCLGPGTYKQVSTTTNSSTNLATNETITLSYSVNEMSGGLGLFSTNTFTSSEPTILLDYVQWGAAKQARVGQAVTAGRWDNAMRFVDGMSPYSFNGNADTFGSTVWEGSSNLLR